MCFLSADTVNWIQLHFIDPWFPVEILHTGVLHKANLHIIHILIGHLDVKKVLLWVKNGIMKANANIVKWDASMTIMDVT